MCCAQCRLTVFSLSISGIVACDKSSISNIFTFSIQFQSCDVPFIYATAFEEESKQGAMVWADAGFL